MRWWKEDIPTPTAVYLFVGNGFDLELGLPTGYKDFLHFLELVERRMSPHEVEDDIQLKSEIRGLLEEHPSAEVWNPVLKSFWYLHFRNISIRSNWIDYENEIARIIRVIEYGMDHLGNHSMTMEDNVCGYDEDLASTLEEILSLCDEMNRYKDINGHYVVQCNITYRELRDVLSKQLEDFIHGFEVYLRDYVEKIIIPAPQSIQNLLKLFKSCKNRYVISFNYTTRIETILRVAGIDGKICYIHGRIGNEKEKNNMVLGMDEYLMDDEIMTHTGFASFRKYNQRIFKATDSQYMDWIEEIKNANDLSRMSLIFGHSLGLTDRDIFESFLKLNNMRTAVFYHNEDHLNMAVNNLTAIIGKKDMINWAGGKKHRIEFRDQNNWIDG